MGLYFTVDWQLDPFPTVICTVIHLMTLITYYRHITSTNSHCLIPYYLRPYGAWLVSWMAVKLSNTGGHTELHEQATVDRSTGGLTRKNTTKRMCIWITCALVYVKCAELPANVRWSSASTRCWYDATLQRMHQCNVLVQQRPTVYAPTGTIDTYSIGTKTMFWYGTGLQY
jgi:hypothetical protein